MNVVQVPVVPIPSLTVLRELDIAIQRRAVEIREAFSTETEPEELKRLAERQGALAFLGEQVKRIRFQISPTIDIIVEHPPDAPKTAVDSNEAQKQPG